MRCRCEHVEQARCGTTGAELGRIRRAITRSSVTSRLSARKIEPMLSSLRALRTDLVSSNYFRIISILPKGSEGDLVQTIFSRGQSYADSGGHAFSAYGVDSTGATPTAVITRPGGMIGAFAVSAAGVEKYLKVVFNVEL